MKLIKEDDKLYHFQTPDGDFKVVKKGLSKSALDKVNAIKAKSQKFSDGGSVPEADPDKARAVAQQFSQNSTEQAITKAIQHPLDTLANVAHFSDGTTDGDVGDSAEAQFDVPLGNDTDSDPDAINPGQPTFVPPGRSPASLLDPSLTDISAGYQGPGSPAAAQASSALPGAPVAGDSSVAPQPPQAPAQSPADQAIPVASKDPFDVASLAGDMSRQEIAQGKLQSQLLAKQAAAQEDFDRQSQMINAESATNHQYLNDQYDQLSKKAMNQEVNPEHFVQNMSTGNKIGTAIGILLSGMGAGAHGSNLALGVLQDHINKDIESQKENINNTHSLLAENMRATGNLYQAEAATRAQMLSMYSGKIQQMALSSGSQQAIGAAQMASDKIKLAYQPAVQAQNQYQMTQKILSRPDVSPEVKIRFGVPAGQQEKAFDALDKAKLAASSSNDILATFNQLKTDNTTFNRALHGGSQPGSATTFDNLIFPLIHDKEGRINPMEAEAAQSFKPLPGDGETKLIQKERGLKLWLKNKGSSELSAYGISLPQTIQTSAPVLSQGSRVSSVPMAPQPARPARGGFAHGLDFSKMRK